MLPAVLLILRLLGSRPVPLLLILRKWFLIVVRRVRYGWGHRCLRWFFWLRLSFYREVGGTL